MITVNDFDTGVGGPEGISSLYGWIDLSLQAGANNTEITTITDAGGLGWVWNKSGTGPLVKAAALNGLRVAQFGENSAGSTTSTRMDITDTSFLGPGDSVSAASMIVLMKQSVDPPAGSYRAAPFQNLNRHYAAPVHLPYSDGDFYDGFMTATRRQFTPSISVGTDWFIYYAHSATNDIAFYINNVLQFSDTSNTVAMDNTARYIGYAGSNYFRGQVAEALFFDAVLSSDERTAMHDYLTDKWGL